MDLLRADRDVGAAAADLRAHGADVDWEIHRHVAGRTALREIEAESPSPLRDALASHVAWLTVARVAQPAERRLVAALAEARAVVRLERDVRLDLRAIVAGLLAANTKAEASAYFAALPEGAEPVREPARTLREVRTEALRRLGIDDVAQRFLGVSSSDLASAARRFLEATSDLARETARSRDAFPLDVDVRLARAAREGWPARLGWRSAAALLPGASASATIPADPPRALGAASFARALAAIGAAVRREPASSSTPLSLRDAPLSPEPTRAGMVFAAALAERSFHARVLGLAAGRAADQARALRAAFLLDARFAAMRVAARARGDWEALTALALSSPLAAALEDAWPLLRDEDLARFFAILSSLDLLDALRDREGDDWFRNPRAFATLRELWSAPAALTEGADARLARRFEELLA